MYEHTTLRRAFRELKESLAVVLGLDRLMSWTLRALTKLVKWTDAILRRLA